LCLVVGLLAAGCGGGDDTGGGGGAPSGQVEPPLTRVAAEVLGRREVAPESVEALLEYSGFGEGPGCPPPGTGTRVGAFAYPPNTDPGFAQNGYTGSQVGDFFTLCAEGMETGRPVDFEVREPGGAAVLRESADAGSDATASVTFVTHIGAVTGEYTVVATQGGDRRAQAPFTVERATSPRLKPMPGQRFPIPHGTAVRIGLAGYPAGSEVPLAVYVSEGGPPYRFNEFRSIVRVRTDEHGEAVLELAIPDDATFGKVLVQTPTLPDDNNLHPDRVQITVGD